MNSQLTILYLLGTNTQTLWREFRYSLRSIARFGGPDLRPCVVGHAPPWFLGDVYAVADCYGAKEKNMMGKIMAAIHARFVEGRFMLSSDDHFLTQPVDLRTMPAYWRRDHTNDTVNPTETNHYFYALAGTSRILKAQGFTTFNTSTHNNIWIDTQDLPEIEQLLMKSRSDPDTERYGLNSYLAWPNVAISKRQVPNMWRQDIKMRGADTTVEQAARILKEHPIVSTADDFFVDPARTRLFEELYPDKSPWEA